MSERLWGAVIVPVTERERILAIPYLSENYGKKEGLAWSSARDVALGKQYPGGGKKEEDENLRATAAREWREEVGSKIEPDRFEPLPVATAILQTFEDDRQIWYGVELFRLILTYEEEMTMRANGATEVVKSSVVALRPRDVIITELYFDVCAET